MSNFDFDVRISNELLEQLHDGVITPSMLLTMTVLYRWSNWDTGIVKFCSASGLKTWTRKAYSDRTFSEALRKLEWMGWITRHMIPGSNKDYCLTIHNYKITNDAGKVQVINQRAITIYEKFPAGRCEEGSDETSWDASDEGSDETSDKVQSETNLDSSLKNQSEDESENPKDQRQVSKEVRQGAKRSLAHLDEQDDPNDSMTWSDRLDRDLDIDEWTTAMGLWLELFPSAVPPIPDGELIAIAEVALDFQTRYDTSLTYTDTENVWNGDNIVGTKEFTYPLGNFDLLREYWSWNQTHKKGGLRHATAAEFNHSWFSDNPRSARIQWEEHIGDDLDCPICKKCRIGKFKVQPDLAAANA